MEKIEIFGDFIDDEIQEVDEFDERYLDDIDYYENNEADGVYINNTYYSYDEYEEPMLEVGIYLINQSEIKSIEILE